MYELRSTPSRVLWFVLGDSVLAIGAAYLLASFFLLASGNGMYGNAAGLVGLLLIIVGGATAIGSIFATAIHTSGTGTESRTH
jgi:hypothetical protein